MGHRLETTAPEVIPLLPLVRVDDVPRIETNAARWLVEPLWGASAVGILGGAPKSCKTFLAVDLALSVASGTKALGRYPVIEKGPVLVYAAEDAPPLLRERFLAMAEIRGLDLKGLPVFLINVPSLRLDDDRDQLRLDRTIKAVRPRLLILDPLVRCHKLDENSATEVSGLLSFLRGLEREYSVSILVVHHTRKGNGGGGGPGEGLRGSGDLFAWTDSLLMLRRWHGELLLTVEHRSARAPEPIPIQLVTDPVPHLEVTGIEPQAGTNTELTADQEDPSLLEEVMGLLAISETPLRVEDLRLRLRVRKQRVVDALRHLVRSGRVQHRGEGFVAAQEPRP